MIIILSLLAIIVLMTIVQMIHTPMRRPTPILRSQILRVTPLGICIGDVIETINEREGWETPIHRDFGFNSLSPWSETEFIHHPRVGEQFMLVPLGEYRTWFFWPPFAEVSVSIVWIFDSDGVLIEVYVRKIGML